MFCFVGNILSILVILIIYYTCQRKHSKENKTGILVEQKSQRRKMKGRERKTCLLAFEFLKNVDIHGFLMWEASVITMRLIISSVTYHLPLSPFFPTNVVYSFCFSAIDVAFCHWMSKTLVYPITSLRSLVGPHTTQKCKNIFNSSKGKVLI